MADNWLSNTATAQLAASNFDMGAFRSQYNADANNRAHVVEIIGVNFPDEEKRSVGRRAGIIRDVERSGSSRTGSSGFNPTNRPRVVTRVVVGDQRSDTTEEESSNRQPSPDGGIAGDNRQSSAPSGVI